jgi:phosphoglycerate dehydrogenase-like enzyme
MALAYKMNVAYYSLHNKPEWEAKGVTYLTKDELLKSSEIVVLCSPTNVVVLKEREFSVMKPCSMLVQASGGSPFDKQAFYRWIAMDGNFALFDMSANEQNYDAYKDLPNVIFSRLVAGDTYESNERRGKRALENLNHFLNS